MADRSVSVPMTLSDLERRDTTGRFSGGSALITLVPFDLEPPNSLGSTVGEGGDKSVATLPCEK